jgi:hypothetical protein
MQVISRRIAASSMSFTVVSAGAAATPANRCRCSFQKTNTCRREKWWEHHRRQPCSGPDRGSAVPTMRALTGRDQSSASGHRGRRPNCLIDCKRRFWGMFRYSWNLRLFFCRVY